jgi:hypothetical protein
VSAANCCRHIDQQHTLLHSTAVADEAQLHGTVCITAAVVTRSGPQHKQQLMTPMRYIPWERGQLQQAARCSPMLAPPEHSLSMQVPDTAACIVSYICAAFEFAQPRQLVL